MTGALQCTHWEHGAVISWVLLGSSSLEWMSLFNMKREVEMERDLDLDLMPTDILKCCYWLAKGFGRVRQRRELSFGHRFSAVGRSSGSWGRTLLQSKRAPAAANWHMTHFLLLKFFPDWILRHKGQRSNRTTGGLSAARVIRSLGPKVKEQAEFSEDDYFDTPETLHFTGSVAFKWQGKASVVADSTPQEQEMCLPHESGGMKPERTPEGHIYLQDNKTYRLRLHKYTQSYTDTSIFSR